MSSKDATLTTAWLQSGLILRQTSMYDQLAASPACHPPCCFMFDF